MNEIEYLVETLTNKDNHLAYKSLKHLEDESCRTNQVYKYFDKFVEMLDNDNSYVRTRGLVLISANAKWDVDYKIDEIIDKYLNHISDDKSITARQCIKSLPNITKYKPDLKDDIINALHNVKMLKYNKNMQPLIINDIKKSIMQIENI